MVVCSHIVLCPCATSPSRPLLVFASVVVDEPQRTATGHCPAQHSRPRQCRCMQAFAGHRLTSLLITSPCTTTAHLLMKCISEAASSRSSKKTGRHYSVSREREESIGRLEHTAAGGSRRDKTQQKPTTSQQKASTPSDARGAAPPSSPPPHSTPAPHYHTHSTLTPD